MFPLTRIQTLAAASALIALTAASSPAHGPTCLARRLGCSPPVAGRTPHRLRPRNAHAQCLLWVKSGCL